MGAINFTGLRKKTGNKVLLPAGHSVPGTPKKEEKITKTIDQKKGLLESRFCYGCLRFSVDAPETPQEKGWCMRDEANGGHAFFTIKPEHKVGQCPIYKNRFNAKTKK